MKALLTGHTKGLGREIYNSLSVMRINDLSIDVIGASAPTGMDISNIDLIKAMVEINDIDVFINNAYHGFKQVELLYAIYDILASKYHRTMIVNVSSNSPDRDKRSPHPYAVNKMALDSASHQLSYLGTNCHVFNIRPGWVDTPRVNHVENVNKLPPKYVADKIVDAVGDWFKYGYRQTTLTVIPE